MPEIRDLLEREAPRPSAPLDYVSVQRRGRARLRRQRLTAAASVAACLAVVATAVISIRSADTESQIAIQPPEQAEPLAPEAVYGRQEGSLPMPMPTALAVAGDSVWVAAGGLRRIDAGAAFPPPVHTQTPVDERIGVQYLSVASDGSLWAANGTSSDENPTAGAVAHVDTSTGSVLSQSRIVTKTNRLLSGLASGGAGVWAVDGRAALRINEQTASLQRLLELSVAASEVAVGATALWVAGDGQVHRIDPATGAVVWTSSVANRLGGIPMAPRGDQLWAASDDEIVLLDENGNQISRLDVRGVQALTVVGDDLWAATTVQLFRVARGVDSGGGSVVTTTATFPRSFGPMAIAGGRAWIADEGSNQVRVIALRP